MEKFYIDTDTNSNYDYRSFTSFEAATQGMEDTVVAIIQNHKSLFDEIEEYINNKFYEFSPLELYIFTRSGILLGYKNDNKWIQNYEDFVDFVDVHKLDDSLLDILIDETLKRIDSQTKHDEKQETIDLILRESFHKIAELIASDIDYLDKVEWRELEKILGEVLSVIGFKVKVTPPSKDGGKDIIVNLEVNGRGYSFIIELKHWKCGQHVGKGYIEKFLRVVINEKRSGGLFLASHGYTEDCKKMIVSIKRYNLNLGTGDKIYSIFQIFQKKQDGLILTPSELLEIVR